jgi:acetate kinase
MEMDKVIIINSGSTSFKYGLYAGQDLVAFYHYESKDSDYFLNQKIGDSITRTNKIDDITYYESFKHFTDQIISNNFISDKSEISLVVFRVVAPGIFFTQDLIIDSDFLEKLDQVKKYSSIHISVLQKEINSVFDVLPNVKKVGISDSAYHRNQDDWQKIYALPQEIVKTYELYRYGYHGLSVESVVENLREKTGKMSEKIVVCHMGGGSSVTAILRGKSAYNSMGYSPMSGLIMSTRVGDIDPEVLFAISENEDLSIEDLRNIVSKKSGLLGISNLSSDIRILIDNFEKDENAKNAILAYINSLKKQIGSAIAIMNGIDTLILTGTIAERSSFIRKILLENLDYFGIEIDNTKNIQFEKDSDFINEPGSRASVYVCHTEEMDILAKKAQVFLA